MKYLTATTNYKVSLGTIIATHEPIICNVPPTMYLLLQILVVERDTVNEYSNNHPEEEEHRDEDWDYYENLIELVRQVGEPRLPVGAGVSRHSVDSIIGHLNITAQKAWTLE